MTEELYKQIWQLSSKVQEKEAYNELANLTKSLIHVYAEQGRIDQNPLSPSFSRMLTLPFDKLNELLRNSTCLVTGGLGCVGSVLVNELLKFDVKLIVILDIACSLPDSYTDERVRCIKGDIRKEEDVNHIFSLCNPQFVFHTAAQRSPGYAERNVYDAFQTNVIGALNIANACEHTESVQQCVFSSTGKASRYFTNEVYAQTKKFCEYIFDVYARNGRVLYSMARFTHIVDNSLMNIELENDSRLANYIAIHSPGKYVTAQNAGEAAALMLNGLIHSQKGHCNFLIVKNLEWPVESLEMALYYIQLSKRNIPVIFKGNPPGYVEKFFRGQLDWSHPGDLNLLINVYEYREKWSNEEGDIIISYICPVQKNTLMNAISSMKKITNEHDLRKMLTDNMITLVSESLRDVNKADTVNILTWGLHPKYLAAEKAKVKDYGLTVPVLADSLQGTKWFAEISYLLEQETAANMGVA